MAAAMSSCLLSRGLSGPSRRDSSFPRPFASLASHRRVLPASCKMRQRSLSSRSRRPQVKKASPDRPPSIVVNGEGEGGGASAESARSADQEIVSESEEDDSDGVVIDVENENVDTEEVSNSTVLETNLAIVSDTGQHLSSIQVDDLMGMIKSAEKNILLLNQARVSALKDLDNILSEKEALHGEINNLEMKLAETDARIRVAAREKMHAELLEDQLEKLRSELIQRSELSIEKNEHSIYENQNIQLNAEKPSSYQTSAHFLSKELSSLRAENISLKIDIETLKAELNSVKDTDERVMMLEKQRFHLESALKDLESKLSVSQEDVSKLPSLKFEYKDLWEKVENLQPLLDRATAQADQAIVGLQQNQVLRKKVDKLEETLEEANVYKVSSEKLQQYNELMHQKIKLLEERLQRSDEEIHSYVQLYQQSVKEFQDTLNTLKKESRKRMLDEPVDDMPRGFWSHLLLKFDGWLLEKKISADDAKLLREMVWKRDRHICDAYMECKDKSEREALAIFLRLISAPSSPGLYVVHIAAEMAPVAKVGGLGDVVTGLSKALQKRGHHVEIIVPKYDCMQYDRMLDLRALDAVVESYFDGRLYKNKVWVGTIDGLPVFFIEPLHPDKFFWRGQFYGEHDDFRRFSFFSRAALELLFQSGKRPDIIHCHDWQTAFVAPLYWDLYAPKGLDSARICFTCHNFEYQGTAPASELASCGLDVQELNRPDRMQDNSARDRVNPVKGAVVFSNIVTTVSPTYAQEVRTAEGGKGLHSTLNLHSKKFVGILNGVDTDEWNPATDAFLEVQYSFNDLQGKAENKRAIRRQLGLSSANASKPMVGCITRLVPQKGVHLIRHALYRTLELGGQFLLLGSSPVPHIQREFEGIAKQFQNHGDIRLILKYDESLSHRIFAASDMLIIPSIFEPCGLTQMIAMRYGSIPIARKTGGLNDSVFDVDDETIPFQFRNGYTFLNADEQGANGALERAFNHYNNDPQSWQQLVHKVMNIEFSWDPSASQYEELYLRSVARARAAR
ncbi:probable starch synthase 4, chloroplastic/amyloplastic isoform X1 [Rhodamnia argentea]|uniref:starch synthase n=1 Tax=Rhodamnia argentea TaxID=178133 RepID=A0A8B8N4A6_9MYRT|nr:probable starch synthase 4, chloroplastic/amyloplastic isoform X1 [Rhodamnia argentea]XP_048141247.1 probable starch synthase 4, chloroplastic/amyloplastic isoform X1 [Rhodamnia argentea]